VRWSCACYAPYTRWMGGRKGQTVIEARSRRNLVYGDVRRNNLEHHESFYAEASISMPEVHRPGLSRREVAIYWNRPQWCLYSNQ